MAKNKCNCGLDNKVFCKNCSKIVMKIMLKNGQKHLKYFNPTTNRNENPTWYSPIKYNSQQWHLVVNKLITAFKKDNKYTGAANCLMFYYNNANQFLHKEVL